MSTCTSTEALGALGYLRRSFTCTDLDELGEHSLLRTFAKYSKVEVLAALEELKSRQAHWPTASAIEQVVRKSRGKKPKGARVVREDPRWDQDFGPDGTVVDIPPDEFTDPADVAGAMASVRAGLNPSTPKEDHEHPAP